MILKTPSLTFSVLLILALIIYIIYTRISMRKILKEKNIEPYVSELRIMYNTGGCFMWASLFCVISQHGMSVLSLILGAATCLVCAYTILCCWKAGLKKEAIRPTLWIVVALFAHAVWIFEATL